MREVAPGLWDWQAPHPEWQDGEPWGPLVSSHALDDGERLLLFDPLAVPDAIRELASRRTTAIVLTAPWHERDTRSLVEELHVPVYAARPDSGQDLIDVFDVSAEEAEGFVSSDLRWLLHEDSGEYHSISAGEPAPFGIEVLQGRTRNDLTFWIEPFRAVISGDTLSDCGDSLALQVHWLMAKVNRDEVAARLRPLLEKPVDVVLSAHGAPADRSALERALA